MAQETKPKIAAVTGIPITVEYKATLCSWEIKQHPDVWVSHGGSRVHPKRFFEYGGYPPHWKYFDPWKVREDFLGLRTESEFLAFLNQVGRFTGATGWGVVTGHWDVETFTCWQQIFREFLRRSPATWNHVVESLAIPGTTRLIKNVLRVTRRLPTQFRWQGARHLAILEGRDVVSAIIATIYVDHLRGATFSFCTRPDCRKAFEFTSKHKRKYCSQYCAHLESLRRMRARQKRKRLKRTGTPRA
jgi:hypothetical protein